MIRLNLPVAIFTIFARRFIDRCCPTRLVPFLFSQDHQLAATYTGSQPSLLLGFTLGVIYIYRRYKNSSRKKVERMASYNSNYSPKRLGTQADTRSCVRRPWYVKKNDAIPNNNRYSSNPPRTRSSSRRRFTLPPAPKKDFIIPLAEEVDSNSTCSNRKPATRTSHQSTMITDSLLTLNECKQFPNSSNYLRENSCLDIHKGDEPCRLQPVLNLSQNCIDLISNDGDNSVIKPAPAISCNSIESSTLGATPKLLMSENELNDMDSKYVDKNLTELSREILYSNARPGDEDRSKINPPSPPTSEMSIETYTMKAKRRKRCKLRFSTKKLRRSSTRLTSSTTFTLNRTRSGRIYNAASGTKTSTTCKRQQKQR